MKLINKETFLILEIEDNKLSMYSNKEYSILIESIEVETKYIKSLTILESYNNYDKVVVEIMSNEEKAQVDTLLLEQELRIKDEESYKGFKYRLTCNIEISEELNTYYSIYKIGLIENNPRIIVYNSDEVATHIISFWNEIKDSILSILLDTTILDSSGNSMFKLEINPYLDETN